MLHQLKILGEYLEDRGEGGLKAYLDVEKISRYDKIISIDFEEGEEGYNFEQVTEHDMKGNETKLLYKFGSARGGDQTPTSCITSIDNTIKRVFKWFDKQESQNNLIKSAEKEIDSKEEDITDEIKSRFSQIDDDSVLTVRFEEEGELKFIKNFDIFQEILKEKVAKRWYDQSSKGKSIAEDKKCTLCKEETTVYGYAFPYNFYTVDNKRFAPDFERKQSWKNIPICEDCSFKIHTGKKFLDKQDFNYYVGENLNYYVIPEFLNETSLEFLDSIREHDDTEEGLLEAERYYKNPKDYINLDFIFYKKEQQSETIQKHVQDVSPSYLNQLEESLKNIFNQFYGGINPYINNESKEIKKLDMLIYRVLPKPDRDNSEAFFNRAMDLTAKILKGRNINEKELIRLFSKEELSRFRNNEYYRQYSVRSFFFLQFLDKNSLLDGRGEDTMKDYEEVIEDLDTEENEELKKFFEEHSDAFKTPERKAVFLEGILAQNLMDKQRMMRETDEPPFRKKLANLRLNEKKVKQLFPEISQTIDIYNSKAEPQYRKSYSDLRETVGHYLLLSDQNGWNISDDEISYYFTLGMSLNQVFKKDVKGDN